MQVISLGWGRQSFCLAAMSALGVLPKVDFAIHADTGYEKEATYKFVEKWTPWLEEHGIPVITVRAKDNNLVNRYGGLMIPAMSAGGGQIRRQCTLDWKIKPIRRYLYKKKQKITLWIGITFDEVQRVKMSNVKYLEHRWPFLEKELVGKLWRRWDTEYWLMKNGLEVPPRSSCYFCPYHSWADWVDLKKNHQNDWQKAVEVDRFIRKLKSPEDLFLQQLRIPLEEIDFSTEEDKGQLSLWDNECLGMCGL